MVALFHGKSRSCIKEFMRASQIGNGTGEGTLCAPGRLSVADKAAKAYLSATDKRHKSDGGERQKKIDRLLSRIDTKNRAAVAVAEVSLASAMQPPALDKVAQNHLQIAETDIQARTWDKAEQELQVIEALLARAPSDHVRSGVDADVMRLQQQARMGKQREALEARLRQEQAERDARRRQEEAAQQAVRRRDFELETSCRGLLATARNYFDQRLYDLVPATTRNLLAQMKRQAPLSAPEVRARVDAMIQDAMDLELTAELAQDQATIGVASNCMRVGELVTASTTLRMLLGLINARPPGHPSHEDTATVTGMLRECEIATRIDNDCAALERAREAGNLRQVYALGLKCKILLASMSQEVMCRTSPKTLAGLRAWQPSASNILVFARLLDDLPSYQAQNTSAVQGTIRALGLLEGPAGPYTVNMGTTQLHVPDTIDSYDHPSMKVRIAAETPSLTNKDAIVTVQIGPNALYFHSCNYKDGLNEIIETTPHIYAEFANQSRTKERHTKLFEAMGFTCIEAQLTALQQAETDPLQEDMLGKVTNQQKCDEFLRVFHLKQIRRYAADHGLNPDGHREYIDEQDAFTRTYFNSTTFKAYLNEKKFHVSPAQMTALMRYEIDVVGVLSE